MFAIEHLQIACISEIRKHYRDKVQYAPRLLSEGLRLACSREHLRGLDIACRQ